MKVRIARKMYDMLLKPKMTYEERQWCKEVIRFEIEKYNHVQMLIKIKPREVKK